MLTLQSADTVEPSGEAEADTRLAERRFQLDEIEEALTSGRLTGQPFERDVAATLTTLLDRLEWSVNSRMFAAALPHFPKEFGVEECRSTLVNLGYPSRISRLPGRALSQCPAATLIMDRLGQSWLIDNVDEHPVLIMFRTSGDRPIVRQVQKNAMYEVVQFERVSPELAKLRRTSIQSNWMSDILGRFGPEIRMLVLLTLLSGGTTIAIAFGITMIFDIVVPTRNLVTLLGILFGAVMLFLVDLSIRRIRANCIGRVSGRMEYVLGSGMFSKLLSLPSTMISGAPISDQMARLRQFEKVRDLFGGSVASVALELPLAILLLAVVAFVALPLAAILLGYILVFATFALIVTPKIRRETRKLSILQSANSALLLEILSQRQLIGRRGVSDVWLRNYEAATRDLARQRRKVTRSTRVLDSLTHASLPLAAGSVIGIGALLAIQGKITGGELIAVTILSWRLFAPIQQSLQIMTKIQDIQGLFLQINTMMRLQDEETTVDQPEHRPMAGKISVDGVIMRHPKSVVPALMNVNLQISRGSFVTVTGQSGSGKSTLLRILAGQLEPLAGSIRINDLNINQLSRSYRSRNIVFVPQTPLYFYGTVAQNLRFANPMASDQILEEMLEEIGLGPWIKSLPKGIETRLDPNADSDVLVSSIRSCLGIAQALLLKPTILLLDETAGGLDERCEECLLAALRARKREMTVVFVTHRPSLVTRSDANVLMENGTATMRQSEIPRKALAG